MTNEYTESQDTNEFTESQDKTSPVSITLEACIAQLKALPHFSQVPAISGRIRNDATDFDVTEQLSFELCGQGEHLYLFIEKKESNSDWIAKQLQKIAGLRSQDVGYAGKKDRFSVSRQWFSLHLPGKGETDAAIIEQIKNELAESISILKTTRHNKKLRTGAIKSNYFKIIIKQLDGVISESSVASLRSKGFPNYYGYQRFGRDFYNLISADKLLRQQIRVRSRNKRGIYLSAARSAMFNLQLANRINSGFWDCALEGDCLMINGSQSFFNCEQIDDDVKQRMESGDIHPSGWLAGHQASQVTKQAKAVEGETVAQFEPWINGLKDFRMDSARRAYRVIPGDLTVEQVDQTTAVIEFSLPAGCFATSLLRELVNITDAQIERSAPAKQEE
ncbi:tRNA pseudouridine(13) synthase TruD [Aliikangiella marina]|uniref:tRNA pseudouridine synthase D n=1 Tax=Aliikangiella marina TaxID=1712262 RepID=A0A545T304_9GAMM|nr:tRNA pseudouridine(13) synthase TruD [Aliikangiella marina]TQV71590.1 tRNA pseudouridine(13) synthase TruD [Aliikangiella marina]